MKKILVFSLLTVAATSYGGVPSFDDDFEGYDEGLNFVSATNGWHASGAEAFVTNGPGYENTKAVVMGEYVALTNTLVANTPLKVWTDFRIKPILGSSVSSPPTNTSSIVGYFNSNGVVCIAASAGWYACTNDVWGNPVAPLTNAAYARLSVCQDYSTSNQAVFLNDQLVLQDMRFVGSATAYNRLVFENFSSNCWVDNVWIHTNVVGLTSNRNDDAEAMADAAEVEQYGYARRTLYVGGAGTPGYDTLQAAVDAWRPRDAIYVYAGTYAESLFITNNAAFEGQSFSVSTLTIAAGASVTFAQSVNCLSSLAITGQVAMASGASMAAAAARVAGNLLVSDGGVFVVTNLDVGGAGYVNFSDAQLVANAGAVVLTGTFSISNTWGTAQSMPLPFSDDFELYATDTALADLSFKGWYASEDTVKVQGTTAHVGKAAALPGETVLSNRISSAATKVWTDYYVRPSLGIEPSGLPTNDSSFVAYISTNGYLMVATAGGAWYACSNRLDGASVTQFQSSAFARITICQDLTADANTFAVFIGGDLVAQGLRSPVNRTAYSSFSINSEGGAAYLDDVLISTSLPSGLTSDLDRDGMPDAYEIHQYGLTTMLPSGAIYRFQ